MAILLHGTTRRRAESILAQGPNLDFVEPGGLGPADDFSMLLEGARPDVVGSCERYARQKAALFSNEEGPAVLVVDVPDDIVELTFDEYFPRSQGLVQFDRNGEALRRLLATWAGLPKHINQV